jgi:hypothetical protein
MSPLNELKHSEFQILYKNVENLKFKNLQTAELARSSQMCKQVLIFKLIRKKFKISAWGLFKKGN